MPDTVGSIRVLFEAQFGKYLSALSQMDRATGSFAGRANRQAATVSSAWRKAGTDMSGFSRQLSIALAAGLSIQTAKRLVDSAVQIKNALKATGLEGDALTSIYGKLFDSAQRNAAPLEGLATLYSRVALAQKELGVNSDQIVGLIDNVGKAIRLSGGDAQQASGALLQLGQALGGGKIQAEEYNSLIDGLPGLLQAAAAGIKEAGGSVAGLTALVKSGKVSSKAFFDGIAAGASVLDERLAGAEQTVSGGLVRLQNVLVDVATRFDDQTHATRTLAHMIDGTLIPAIRELGDIFSSVSNGPIGQFYDWLGKTIDRVVQLSADLGAMTGLDEVGKKFGAKPYIGQGRIQDRINSAFEGTSYTTPKADKPGTELTVTKPNSVVKPITLADYPVTGGSGTKGGRGSHRATADDRFAETIQDVKDRTAALKEEQATLGMSFEAQQKRSVALQLEQEALRQVREEARRKGDADWQNVQLSPEQVKQIDEVSAAYARQADALRQTTEAQDLQRDVLKGVFQDVRSALADGKITTEEWGNIFLNVLDKIIDKIEDQLIDAILSSGSAMGGAGASGGGGLGIIGALIGGVGKLLGFEKGGYTGEGGLDEPKGVVHGKEFVVNARATAKNRPLLEALNRGVPGFRAGGFVGKNMGALMGSKLGFAFPTGGEAGMGVSGSLPV